MTTVSLHSEGDTTLDQFDSFMADLLWEKEVNISIYSVVTSVYRTRAGNEPSLSFLMPEQRRTLLD